MRGSRFIFPFVILSGAPACLAGDGLPRGCHEMPYVRYEAEAGLASGGAVSRTAFDFDPAVTASEASNRHYVGLPANGSAVAWTVEQQADGATLRFTLPDNAAGTGLVGSLDVMVNNTRVTTITLGSYWAWTYFETTDPQNTPGSRPRMRFDEIRFLIPGGIQAGDELKIVKTNGDAHEYGIDFIEIEPIQAALTKPAGYVSVADHGASGNDETPDSDAFDAAWYAAKTAGTGLYIPPGKYVLNRRWNIGDSAGLAIMGAGIWHTELFFSNKTTGGGGINTGKNTTGIEISHFYMNSALNERHIVAGQVADYKAVNGPLGAGSWIHHLWMNHFEAGAWPADYTAPVAVTSGLDFSHNRVRGMYADGINLAQGAGNCVVRQSDFRNCGDDAVAIWTSNVAGAPEGNGNIIQNCSIEFTYRAAAIAIFGGYGHEVHHCLMRGGTGSSGIRFTEDFPGYHFQNNTRIRIYQNTFDGQGTSRDLWNNPRGAIEISGGGVKSLDFDDNEILNSPHHAIQLGGGQGLTFDNTTIQQTGLDAFNSPGGAAIHEYGPAGGADFTNLAMSGIENQPPVIRGNPDYLLEIHSTLQPCPFEMAIGFPGYNRSSKLYGFPVLVKLGPHLPGFSYASFASPDGSDLRFRDALNRELQYEIETWNPAGTSFVWVRVPTLEAGTVIHAAWGSPRLAQTPTYTGDGSTWSASFAAVYHANGGAGIRRDSSSSARHGTPVGNTITVPGMIAGADAFDGNGDAVRLPPGFGLFDGSRPVTVEFWFNAAAVAPNSNWQSSPVLFEARAENSWMLAFGDSMPADSLGPRLDQGGWNTPVSAGGVTTGQWRHFAASYTPSGTNNWKIHLDGVIVSQGTRTGAVAAAAMQNHYGGSAEAGTTRWFTGMMDEIRISSQARSSDWLWTVANQISSHQSFTSYGPVSEVGPRNTLSITSDFGGSVHGSAPGPYIPGATVALTAEPNPYFSFGGWTGDVPAGLAGNASVSLDMDQPRSVAATFVAERTSLGVPKWWLAQYGWSDEFEAASIADHDGDGHAAWREFLAGTDPTNPGSYIRFTNFSIIPAGLDIRWSSVFGKSYRIESANTPAGPWVTVASAIPANPPENALILPSPGAAPRFFRVAVE